MTTGTAFAPTHWPDSDPAAHVPCVMQFPAGPVTLAQIAPDTLERAVAAVRRAQRRIASRPVRDIIGALDACAAAWCQPGDDLRERALEWLGTTTGCAPAMLTAGLRATFDALREPHLTALVTEECGGLEALDGGLTAATGCVRAVGPDLTWIIGGGIVPNALAVPVFATLLCKSAALVKTPTREPLFGALLADSLAAVDADLGACVAAGWWAGGTGALDAVAADAADTVIATGTDTALAAVRARVGAGARVIAYGDRVSLIAVGREHLTAGFGRLLWSNVAEAVGWYDQHGCLSPHVVYVEEGGDLAPRQAAEALADAMALYEVKAPRGPVSADVAAALQARREHARVRAVDADKAGLWTSPDSTAWTIAFDRDPGFVRSPGYRFVTVKPVYDLEDLPALLERDGVRCQGVGLEVAPERRAGLAEALGRAGASRVCPVDQLQRPPVNWPRDGQRVLAPLLRWVQA